MFVIGEAVVDDAVAKTSFCCDLEVCKGACCTLDGGRGAPLLNSEVEEIRTAVPSALRFLSERNRMVIESVGPVEGVPGDFATTCFLERDCVFVYYDDQIARCALERAFAEGLTEWKKPLSCHLFPLRVRKRGSDLIRYEEISECAGGRARGSAENVALHEFLAEPLTRLYGRGWYQQFRNACIARNGARQSNIA